MRAHERYALTGQCLMPFTNHGGNRSRMERNGIGRRCLRGESKHWTREAQLAWLA